MKFTRIAPIGLVALVMLIPGAGAQQNRTTVTLVQTAKPVTRAYPGVSADILGIRTGMTVSQAEAVAEKSYPGKPNVLRVRDTFDYKDVTVQSDPYVQTVDFKNNAEGRNDTAPSWDELSLVFSGPASGNRLYAISRTIAFNPNPYGPPKDALTDPLVSTLKASLLKKHGPTSNKSPFQGTEIARVFTQKSRISCSSYLDCESRFGGTPLRRSTYLNYLLPKGSSDPVSECSAFRNQLVVFSIQAGFSVNRNDQSKADSMTVQIWDPQACLNDVSESIRQLKADAIKYYKTASKAPAGPKL